MHHVGTPVRGNPGVGSKPYFDAKEQGAIRKIGKGAGNRQVIILEQRTPKNDKKVCRAEKN